MRMLRPSFTMFSLALLVGGLATPAHAAFLTVSKTADTLDGACNSDCSLREAIAAANAASDLDVILIPPGTYTISRDDGGLDDNAAGDLDVLNPVTIVGAGASSTTVDGNGAATSERVFDVFSPDVTLLDMRITGGNALSPEDLGGGVHTNAESGITLAGVWFHRNHAGNYGGGVELGGNGQDTIVDSLFSENTGGAATISTDGPLFLFDVTIHRNSVTGSCGGMEIFSALEASHLTITENRADSDNNGGNGGGICGSSGAEAARIGNSIIAGNTTGGAGSGPDCYGTLDSEGNNLIGSASGCTGLLGSDTTGVNPLLGPLADNGGPTMTQALLTGSPAIDTASDEGCTVTDQRGVPRPAGSRCDRGAYERAFCAGVLVNRVGTDGDDVVSGTAGADGFLGLDGDDRFRGLGGNDGACGGHGNDRLVGGAGKDILLGQQDDDRLLGGRGKDKLRAGPGTDVCVGGPGTDKQSGCER